MKIIKLEINNFRQFYGKQTIEFATGDKHSVTLIHGENNGGKTALLNALSGACMKRQQKIYKTKTF